MSLAITYDEIRREIGRFLGYSRDPVNWTSDQVTDVGDIIKSGLRRFYWPLGDKMHRWSFLRPVATLVLSADTRAYDLPADFGGALESFAYAAGQGYRTVERITEEEIRSLHSTSDVSGPPQYFALRVKPHVEGEATAYEVVFYPVPDDAYSLSYRYAIEPDTLGDINDMPLGGAIHSETILESCLAAAEKVVNDEESVHAKRFIECLAASIQFDQENAR